MKMKGTEFSFAGARDKYFSVSQWQATLPAGMTSVHSSVIDELLTKFCESERYLVNAWQDFVWLKRFSWQAVTLLAQPNFIDISNGAT